MSQIKVLFVSSVLFVFLSAITLSHASENDGIIWQENQNIYIKYSSEDGSRKINNAHPQEIKPETLLAALSSLYVVKKKDKQVTLFSPEQQSLLAEHLSSGFARGRADQDIVFALQREEKTLAGLKTDQYFVAGRAFYQNDKLNLIIGDYDKPRNRAYEMAYDPTNRGLVRYTFNVGSRSANDSVKDTVSLAAYNIPHSLHGNRQDWLQLDTENLDLGQVVNPVAPNTTAAYTGQVRQPQPRLQAQPRVQNQGSASNSTLIERFKTLEALKNNGLITEEEYQKKRKALLDEL